MFIVKILLTQVKSHSLNLHITFKKGNRQVRSGGEFKAQISECPTDFCHVRMWDHHFNPFALREHRNSDI